MSMKMIVADKRFAPLFWTQFFGALNDNVLKNALVVLVTFKITVEGLATESIVALASGLFILPFFLFSPIAGQVADRLEKSRLVRITKYWELLIMIVGGFGFYFHSTHLLLATLFLAGVQATLFGPCKYSMLPELVSKEQLIEANAFVEMGTFLAILIGTIGGGVMIMWPNGEWWVIGALILFSLIGVITAVKVPATPVASPNLKIRYNPGVLFKEYWVILRQSQAVFNSILGISWFWFFGAAVLSILPVYCKNFLGAEDHVFTCFLAMFTIGIAVGSILCEKLSFKRVEIGLVPIGSIGMTLFLIDLYRTQPTWAIDPNHLVSLTEFIGTSAGRRLMFDFFMTSVFGGFFILPLYTLIQERSNPDSRSRVIAGNNIMNALFMVFSAALVIVAHKIEMTYTQTFMALAIINAVVSIYIYSIVPEFTMRFWAWIIARFLYRIKCYGEENIPKQGAAVLVCNHASYADWLIIAALVKRPVRFVMFYKFFQVWFLKGLLKQAKVIPIAGVKEDIKILNDAFEAISRELRDGEIVCIFPEGKVTKDGNLDSFKSGIEKILARDPVPVIPMALNGMWGSWFSKEGGKALMKVPRRWMSPVNLRIGKPLPAAGATAESLSNEVAALMDK